MPLNRARSRVRHTGIGPRLWAVALVLVIILLAIITSAAMTREEPEAPEFPVMEGIEEVASGSMPIPMLGLDYENARSTVFTDPGAVPDVFRFYTQDVTQQGWTVVSGVEDSEGTAVVYLMRYDTIAMVQIMDTATARDRRTPENPRLNVNSADFDGAGTVVIVGRFECTDESGTAVCLDYIRQEQREAG